MWHYVRLTDPYLKHADPLYDGFNPYVGLSRLPFFKITMNKLACVLLSIRLIHSAIKQPWLRDMQLVNLKCSWMDSWLYQLWSSPSSSYLHLHNYHNNYRIIITVIIIITINIIHHHHQQQHPVNRSSTWRQSSNAPENLNSSLKIEGSFEIKSCFLSSLIFHIIMFECTYPMINKDKTDKINLFKVGYMYNKLR